MKRLNKIGYSMIGVILLSTYSQGTTVFARQYDVKCTVCHVGTPPMLNKTGMKFFRNGFRFSKDDITTLKKVMSNKDALIPLGLFLGGATKSLTLDVQTPKGINTKEKTVDNPTGSLFLSGSLNRNWSAFVGSKFAYMKDKNNPQSNRSIEILRKKFYAQYTNEDAKHVTRVGLLSPYAHLGNVDKGSEYTGLNDVPDLFITPLMIANDKFIYGFDYTYQADNGLTFLGAAGQIDDGNNENDMTLGVSYSNDNNLRISTIVNQISATDSASQQKKYKPSERLLGERTTVIVPIEYSTDLGYLNTAFVYSDLNRKVDENYYGSESTLTVPIFEVGKVRAVYTTDNNGDRGYSFGYSQIFSQAMMLSGSYTNFSTDKADFDSLGVSLSYIY